MAKSTSPYCVTYSSLFSIAGTIYLYFLSDVASITKNEISIKLIVIEKDIKNLY